MKYRKKPVVIEAVRFTGDNFKDVSEFAADISDGCSLRNGIVYIDTLEGTMAANEGDWIIKGVKGEFYPCKPDIFAMTYEPVETPQ